MSKTHIAAKVWLWIIKIIKHGGRIIIYNPTKSPIKLEENRCSPNAYTFYKNNLKQIRRAPARNKLHDFRGDENSRNVGKRTIGHVRPVKIQASLRIRAVWPESSLVWIAKDAKFLHVNNEYWSDCANVPADLNRRWVHLPDVAVQIRKRTSLLMLELFWSRL